MSGLNIDVRIKPLPRFNVSIANTVLKVKSYASEEEIKMLLKSEPERAFRLLVEKFGSKLYWHIRRLVIIHADADDALQNTFINAWKGLGGFRSESSLYTWLYSIATNEALTLIRKREKTSGVSLDDVESIISLSTEGDSYFDGNEATMKLQNAIMKLPDKQRIVFNMKYFDDMSYEEISLALGTSVGALKASYHHAVKKIEKFIIE